LSTPPDPGPEIICRSPPSVVRATSHPRPSGPIRCESGTRALSRNTSLNSASPLSWRSGRTSTPGWCMSIAKYVMPSRFGAAGSVRASSIPISDWCAHVLHTFWPVTTHSSPSRTALVASDGRSEPAPGSLNSWHHRSVLRTIGGR
jgi:hypothetical protein